MKKIFIFILLGLFLVGFASATNIYNWTQLQQIGSSMGGTYVLMNNLSSSDADYAGIGSAWTPLAGTFSGSFDGQNNTISNLIISKSGVDNGGLFITTTGTIKNLGVLNVNITAKTYVGTITGTMSGGTITNVWSSGNVTGLNYVGGIIGWQDIGTTSLIHSSADIYSLTNGQVAGGAIGYIYRGSFTTSYATGNIKSLGSTVGGLVGRSDVAVTNSYATGNVTGLRSTGGLAGLLANIVTTSNCYATGNVTGTGDANSGVGGLVGTVSGNGIISNSFSIGKVVGTTNVGGLVGYKSGASSVTNSYWDTNTSNQTTSIGGVGLSTSMMKLSNPYNYWSISYSPNDLNNGYPYLAMQSGNTSYVWLSPSMNNFWSVGDGTVGNPYQINNWTQLYAMLFNLTAYYTLNANISSATSDYTGRGDTWTALGAFSGNFDGQNNIISNLTGGSLFSSISGTVSNLGLSSATITGSGGLASSSSGTITNCFVTGRLIGSGNNVGGLFGSISAGTISNSYTNIFITDATGGSTYVGGIVGDLSGTGSITNTYALGNITATPSYGVGGLVGDVYGYSTTLPLVSGCYATGNITGLHAVGGLVGAAWGSTGYGKIINSYARGNVVATGGTAGGLFGSGNSGAFTNCYSTGTATTGGLLGAAYSITVTNSFWDNQTSGKSTSAGGTGKLTSQMKNFSTFSTWNISLSSSVNLNDGYPFLAWQGSNNSFVWLMTPVPAVSVTYPLAINYNENVSQINYTYYDQVGNGYCWASTDGGITNSSSVSAGTTLLGLISKSGTNLWNLFCNNTWGFLSNNPITFFINSLWYNSAPVADNSFRVSEFVNVSGTNFTLGGQRYRFLGADAYYLIDYATNHTYDDAGNEINNSQVAVQEVLNEGQYLNINVLRIWALMVCGGNTTNGTASDWANTQYGGHYNCFLNGNTTNYNEDMYKAMDYTIYEMSKRDIRGQVVFVNNWDAYGGMRWWVEQSPTANYSLTDGTDAFHDQFYTDPATIVAFQNYINYTLNRNNTYSGILYKNDPTIMSWQLTNEARAKGNNNANSVANLQKITNWTRNMTTFVKSIDSNHLVTLGLEGFSYNETWGEGTDFILSQNNTGIDFATFELHPAQWDYFAQRSELNSTNGIWVNGTISAVIPGAILNKTLLWWVNGSGQTWNSRYSSNVAMYDPRLARHGYSNWVSQNVNWSKNLLHMPVVIEELALPTNTTVLTDGQKALFFDNAIHNFYSAGGDGLMMWNLNHDGYYTSTTGGACTNSVTGITGLGCMDDGYSFYLSDDPTLKAKSKGVIDAYNFTLHDNNGGSWVNTLHAYAYDFTVNIDNMDDAVINNCSLVMTINNGTTRNVNVTNSSTLTKNVDYVFSYSFNSGDLDVDWYTTCCSNISCYNSNTTNTALSSTVPVVNLISPQNNTVTNNDTVDFQYSTSSFGLDINNCQLIINGSTVSTNVNAIGGITQDFVYSLSNTGTNYYDWKISCTDIVGTIGMSETRNLIIDENLPNAVLISPINNTFQGSSSDLNYNASDDLAIKNVSIELYDNNSNLINSSFNNYTFYNAIISVNDATGLWSSPTYASYYDVYGAYDAGSWSDTSAGSFQNDAFDIQVYSYVTASDMTRVYALYGSYSNVGHQETITSINPTPSYAGSGYAVNDLLYIASGYWDGIVQVDAVTIGTILTAQSNADGAGYLVNDVLTLTGGDNTATVTVLSVGGSGEVTSVSLTTTGSGYAYGYYATTGGSGDSGATILVSSVDGAVGGVTSVSLYSGGTGYYVGAYQGTYYGGAGIDCQVEVTAISSFQIITYWGDYGGTPLNAEGYVITLYDYNTGQPYYWDVGGATSLVIPDFTGFTNGWFSNTPSAPYSVSTGYLPTGQNDWYVWAYNNEDGEIVYSANPTTTSDSDSSGVGWTTTLSWDDVSADGYILYNSVTGYWIDVGNVFTYPDNGDYSLWTAGVPTTTPTSPYTYNHAGTLSMVSNLVTTLVDGVYNWFVNIFDWSGNNYQTQNNTLTVDTTNPLISFLVTTESNGANSSHSWIYMNTSWIELNFDSITFWVDGISASYSFAQYDYNKTGLSDGVHSYYATICDKVNNCNSTETRTINIDTVGPILNISSPLNSSTYSTQSIWVPLNITATDSLNLGAGYWEVNGGEHHNFTITNNTAALLNMSWDHIQGATTTYYVTICVNDSVGNLACEVRRVTLSNIATGISGGFGEEDTIAEEDIVPTVTESQTFLGYITGVYDYVAFKIYPTNQLYGRVLLGLILLVIIFFREIIKFAKKYKINT